jgi:hypothetical protein
MLASTGRMVHGQDRVHHKLRGQMRFIKVVAIHSRMHESVLHMGILLT